MMCIGCGVATTVWATRRSLRRWAFTVWALVVLVICAFVAGGCGPNHPPAPGPAPVVNPTPSPAPDPAPPDVPGTEPVDIQCASSAITPMDVHIAVNNLARRVYKLEDRVRDLEASHAHDQVCLADDNEHGDNFRVQLLDDLPLNGSARAPASTPTYEGEIVVSDLQSLGPFLRGAWVWVAPGPNCTFVCLGDNELVRAFPRVFPILPLRRGPTGCGRRGCFELAAVTVSDEHEHEHEQAFAMVMRPFGGTLSHRSRTSRVDGRDYVYDVIAAPRMTLTAGEVPHFAGDAVEWLIVYADDSVERRAGERRDGEHAVLMGFEGTQGGIRHAYVVDVLPPGARVEVVPQRSRQRAERTET